MKAPSERGLIGAWAYQARQELGLSVEQVAAAMDARGQAVSPATIRGIESGSKKPGARLLRVLSQVLESTPPGAPVTNEPAGDASGLVQAMTVALLAQARAFTAFEAAVTRRFEEATQEREVMLDSLARLEAELGELRAAATTEAGSALQRRVVGH